MQFEWFILSVQPQLSREHRNTFSTYENKQVCHLIKKIEIENSRDNYSRIDDKVFDLNDLDNRHSLYRQFRASISKGASTGNALNTSKNKEVQQTTRFYKFFTKDAADKIYIDMRETLGYTGQKDATKRDDSMITINITLEEAAATNLQVLIQGQGIREYIYKKWEGGNMLQFYEYKTNSGKKSRKFGPTGISDVTAPANKEQKTLTKHLKIKGKFKLNG